MSDLLLKEMVMSRNQPLNRRILSGHLIEVDSKTLTIRYKFVKFNNYMFPCPILTVFALPHSIYTVGTPLKFYIKVYNTKRSPIFSPNGDSLNFQNMSIKWEVPGGGGGGWGNCLGEKLTGFGLPLDC